MKDSRSGRSQRMETVRSACPLDCPDACSLAVTVDGGRVVSVDGTRLNSLTRGFICGKVRHFAEHAHGPDRLLYPARRRGRKGTRDFERLSWDAALDLVV